MPRRTSKNTGSKKHKSNRSTSQRSHIEPLESRLMLAVNHGLALSIPLPSAQPALQVQMGPVSPALREAMALAQAQTPATVTASGATTAYPLGSGQVVVDASLQVTSPGAETYESARVLITGGYDTGEDVLALSGFAGVTANYSAGALDLSFATPKTAAQVQAVLRAVTYQNLQTSRTTIETREITFEVGAGSDAKSVQTDWVVDSNIRTSIVDVFNVIQGIGTKIQSLAGTPGKDDTTAVPYTNYTVTDLLYPNSSDLDSSGNPVADYTKSVQPQQIGGYLQLKSAVQTYFTSAGAASSLAGLQTAVQTELATLVTQASATRKLDARVAASNGSITLTLTIVNTKGFAQDLDLADLQRELGLRLPSAPTIDVGGGADIQISFTINLAGHTAGNAIPAANVDLNVEKINSLAGFTWAGTTDVEIGVIRGEIVDGSVVVGARIPVTFGGSGAHRTLNNWATNGSDVSGFGSLSGSASMTLPISASINGVSATTASTRITVTDANIFDTTRPVYSSTDYAKLEYFGSITANDVIQEVLRVGRTLKNLEGTGNDLLGLYLPFLSKSTLADLIKASEVFEDKIGSQIDIYEPVVRTAGRDELTDWRLPLSSDSTPEPSMYSDLRAGFQFGVVLNGQWPVYTVTIAADGTRNNLDDLISDVNAALTTAGLDISATNEKNKMVLTATDVAVQSFAIVPVASPAGLLSPNTPPADLNTLTVGTSYYYTVTGTTSGTIKGTNYYTLDTALGAAAVHAGILDSGQSGVVKVTRVGAMGSVWGTNRNGISSADSSGQAYLIETAVSDLRRLGIVPFDSSLAMLESVSSGKIRASLPLAANLSGAAKLVVVNDATRYTVNVADNGRTDRADTLADVKAALVSAGVAAVNLTAKLVDSNGDDAPDTLEASEDYYLQLYLPDGSGWTTFSVDSSSEATAYQVIPLGFTAGTFSDQPRPSSLRTFEDFQDGSLFPGLSMTAVYDNTANTVTLNFAVSQAVANNDVEAGFDFKMSPLGGITPTNTSLNFDVPVTTALNFGVEFQIGPSKAINVASGTGLPSNGRLTSDAHLTLDLLMQDRYSVTLPSAWTSANANVQDLVSDLNLALKNATDSSAAAADLTAGQIVARKASGAEQIELVTATPTNGGSSITVSHSAGVLSSDLSMQFTHGGTTYLLSLAADDTAGNTSFSELVANLNDALSSVVIDANANGSADATEIETSLAADVFFTTISGAGGAASSKVYLYTTDPTGAAWPSTVVITAARTDSAVTELMLDDGADAAVSTITAKSSGTTAGLRNHSNDEPIIGATIDVTLPTFAGSTSYGFSTLNFAGSTGGIHGKIGLALTGGTTADTQTISGDVTSYFERTITGVAGTGNASAAMTLSTITASGATIDPAATIALAIADLSATQAIVAVPIGVPISVPEAQANGKLDSNATVSFIHGGALYRVTVTSAAATGNTDFAQLAAQFNSALTSATRVVSGVTTAGFDASGLFQIAESDGQLEISALTETANPDYASVSLLPGASAFGEIGLQGSFGPSTVADAIQDSLPVLDAIQAGVPEMSDFELPLIKTKLSDLIDIKGSLLSRIDKFRSMTVSSVGQIQSQLALALGVPVDQVQVTFDDANSAYRVDVQYENAIATKKPLDMTLSDFYKLTGDNAPAGLARLVDSGGASLLTVKVLSTVVLSLGIDLSDPEAPRAFLYGHDGSADLGLDNGTSVQVEVEISGDNINFTAAMGAFGVFVREGNVHLGGKPVEAGPYAAYTFDEETNQLHFAGQTGGAVLAMTLGGSGGKFYLDPQGAEDDAGDLENYSATFDGSLDVNLPLFTPTEFVNPFTNRTQQNYILGQGMQTVHPGGNLVDVKVEDFNGFKDASLDLLDLNAQIAAIYSAAGNSPLSGAQQSQVDALNGDIADLKDSGAVEIFTPDVESEETGIRTPTLLDLVRDPAILVDGLDVIMGSIETGLRGLNNLDLPVVGPVLGDAVKGVFRWRTGWLKNLRNSMRGQGEAVFEAAKKAIYDFLGPSGLNILLKDNGIRSVDGMVRADDVDDVGFDFLDENGEKLTGLGGYGAHAVQFKIRIGQKLVDTGVNLGFDFDSLAPALTLGISGGLTFKLGWDMTLGFGIDLENGFYVAHDSRDGANEMELRFEAGLSGDETGFGVAKRAASPTGYSIKDKDGNWVLGPRKGDGTREIINVLPVYEDGSEAVVDPVDPPLPQNQCEDATIANPQETIYWVVAADAGGGNWVPAYLDRLGFYRAQSGATWATVNGEDELNPDQMILYNQTAPFTAYGSLFFLKATAVDNVQVGINPKGDTDYFYDPSKASTITSAGRKNGTYGVNRNNTLPTRIAGRIGININDPSSGAGDYVARPGATITGFALMDGTTPLGGELVLGDDGLPVPVKYVQIDGSWGWYVMSLKSGETDASIIGNYEVDRLITEDESEDRLTFTEIKDTGLSVFEFKLDAEAVVNLHLLLQVSENANIPRLTADFNLDWRSDSMVPPANPFSQSEEQKRDLVPEVGINNIRLDLGSFLTKFMKPIAEKIDSAFEPLDPLIDVLQTPIPVISDLAGRDIKLTTLLVQFGGPKGKAIGTLIEMVILARELSGVMAAVPDGANVYLPIGNFWLAKVGAGPLGRPGLGTQIYYDNSEVSAPSITQRNQSLIADPGAGLNAATNALGKIDALDKGSSSQPGVPNEDRGGFDIPLLNNPMTVFKLLMGQDVPLVTFSLPKLDFSFNTDIPLVRILILEIGLRFDFQVHGQLAMGYDTAGIREFAGSHDPVDLLDGFYISDRQNADGTGADVDEFTLDASIALYGEVDAVLAKAGVEGGFHFHAGINLNDPNNDGKLRVPEMWELVSYTNNPLDLADLTFSGDVYARYYYWVGLKIWTPWKTYTVTLYEGGETFAKMQVFSFTRDGRDGPPVLASIAKTIDDDGTEHANSLLLNVGPSAAKRVSNEDPLKTLDGAERYVIWNDSPGSTTVHVKYLNYSNTYTKTYTNVSRVVAKGGAGNDSLDASGLRGIAVDFDGGAGNDTLLLGSGDVSIVSTIKGGLGDDVITLSGGGSARLDGEDGNDTLTAGTGDATITGGSGNDTISGGGAASSNRLVFARDYGLDTVTLNTAATDNILDFVDSSLPVTAALSGVGSTVTAGQANRATFSLAAVTEIDGSTGGDTFNITAPSTRNANSGKGLIIRGGPGTDTYAITGDNLASMASNGITIDDNMLPTATATTGVVTLSQCGKINDIEVDTAGAGYVVAPDVIIEDATGTGARAVAGIDSLGRVTGIYMINGGSGYTNPTIKLINQVGFGDKITYTAGTTATVTLDHSGNSGADYRISSGGKFINFVGWGSQGDVRPDDYQITEIDNLTFTLPSADLQLDADVDILGSFTLAGRRIVQNASIFADTVKISTDRGFQVNHTINTTNNGDIVLRVTGKNQSNYTPAIGQGVATVSGGAISGVEVNNSGNYYDFAPVVTIRNGGGTGAKLIATASGGQITAIDVSAGGSSYRNLPRPQVWIAPPASIQINAPISTSTVGSNPGTGDGRGQVTLRADLGAINMSGDVQFPTGSYIDWVDGDYVYRLNRSLTDITPGTYPATVGGSGATATAVLDGDGRVTRIDITAAGSGYSADFLPTVSIQGAATATAIVDGSGHVTGFNITNPGEGYAVAPRVTIISNGFGKIVGADATQTALNRVFIKSAGGGLVAAAYYGVGDPNKPLKTDVANFVAQTTQQGATINVLEKDSLQIGLIDQINGINTIEGDVSIATFVENISLGSPIQQTDSSGKLLWEDAKKTIPIFARDEQGKILYQGGRIQTGQATTKLIAEDVDINSYVASDGDTLILEPVSPEAEIGLNGTRGRATAVISGGQLTGFTDFWSGRGYTEAPLVTLTPPGQRAAAVANVGSGQVVSVNLVFAGTNYNDSFRPIVTLTGGGIGGATPAHPAVVEAQYDENGAVTGFTITDAGAGYLSAPEVSISLPGVQATAVAVIADGVITGLNIVNPGSNYTIAPAVTIASPFPFNLDAEEVAHFQDGFDQVIIGRADGKHVFHAADAHFNSSVTLRAPALGGAVIAEQVTSQGALAIMGSGATTHLTSASPTLSATEIDLDDNVIVDDGVDGQIIATDGHVAIFGTGKGKIDGVTGSTSENLTITAATDIQIEGAIGSSFAINNLTLNAQAGAISLKQINIEGDLHIVKGTTVTFGGDVTIGGDLIIDQGAAVNFSGAINIAGDLTITQATSVSFNGMVTIGGTLTIPTASNVSFAQNVSVGALAIGSSGTPSDIGQVSFATTARLDATGAVAIYSSGNITFGNAVGQVNAPTSITLQSQSGGDIAFQGNANVGASGITIIKTRHITFANDLTTASLTVLDATGDARFQGALHTGTLDVTASGIFQAVHEIDLTVGNAVITANNVDFSGGSGTVVYTGSGSSTLTIKPRTLNRQITIASPPGVFTSLDLSDSDLAAIAQGFAHVYIGDAAAGTGTVTIGNIGSQQGMGNSQLFNPTSIYGGTINVVQGVDVTIDAATLRLQSRTGNININAAINSTAEERGSIVDFVALAGAVVVNNAVYSTSEIRIDASTTVSETASGYLRAPSLRVTAGAGVTLNHASNALNTVTIHSAADAISLRNDGSFAIGTVDGQSGLSAATTITLLTLGTVSQTQAIAAPSLLLTGAGATYTLAHAGNDIATLAANTGSVRYHDTTSLTIGTVGGVTGVTTTGSTDIDADDAFNVTAPVSSGTTATLTSQQGTLTTSAAGDITAAGTIALSAATGISASGDVTSTAGDVAFNDALTLTGDIAITATTGKIDFNATVDGAHQLTASAPLGIVRFHSVVGNNAPLTRLIISNAASAVFDAAITLSDDLTVSTTGNATFNGAVNTPGDLLLASTSGKIYFVAAIGNTTAPATLAITTAASAQFDAPVTLAGPFAVTTTGAVDVKSTLDTPSTVTVTTPGNVHYFGVIGGNSAPSDLTVTNAATAVFDQAITLTDDLLVSTVGNSTFSGAVSTPGDLSLTSTSGKVYFVAAVGNTTAPATLTVIHAASAQFDASITLDGAFAVTATGAVDVKSTLNTPATVNVSTPGNVRFYNAIGNVLAPSNINVSTPATARFDGAVTLSNDLTVTAVGDITFGGFVNTPGDLLLSSSSGKVYFVAAIGNTAAPATLTISTAASAQFDSPVTLAGPFAVTATGAVDVNSTLDTSGTVTVSTPGNVHFVGEVGGTHVPTTLNVSTPATATFDGAITLSSDLTVSAVGDITFGGAVNTPADLLLGSTSGKVYFIAAIGNATAPATLTITQAASAQFDGPVKLNGPMAITASGAVDVKSTVDTTGAITVTTSGAVHFYDTIGQTIVPTTLIITSATTATFDGAVVLSGDLSVSTSGNMTFNGAVNTPADLILNSTSGKVYFVGAIGNTNAPATLTVTGAASAQFDSAIRLDGAFNVTATGAIDVKSTLDTPGSVGVSTLGNVHFYDAIGNSFAPSTLSITSASTAVFDGPITLTDDLWTSTAGNITFNGTVNTPGDLTLNSSSGKVYFVGAVGNNTAPTTLTISHAASAQLDSAVRLNGAFAVTTTGAVDVKSTLDTPGTVAVSTPDNVRFYGAIGDTFAPSTLTITNAATATFDDTITLTADLSVSTVGNSTFNGAVNTPGDLLLTSTSGKVYFVAAIGNTAAPATLTITHSASAEFDGPVALDGPFAVTSTGAVDVKSTLDTPGSITVSTPGNVHFYGQIGQTITPTTLTVTNAATAVFDGAIKLSGDLSVSAAGAVTFGGTLNTLGDLELASTSGKVYFVGAVGNTTAPATLTISHAASAQFDSAVKLSGAFAVSATGAVDIKSTLDTPGSANVSTSGNVRFYGAVGVTNAPTTLTVSIAGNVQGDVTLTATTGIKTLSTLDTPGDVVLSASGGLVYLVGAVGGTQSPATLTVLAAASFQNDGAITLDGAMVIHSTGDIQISGAINTPGSMSVDSSAGSVYFAAAIGGTTPPAELTVSDANDIEFNAAAHIAGDVELTASNAIRFNSGLTTDTGMLTVSGAGAAIVAVGITVSPAGGFHRAGSAILELRNNASITTSDSAITVDSPLLLTGNATLDSNGGAITLATINGAKALTIDAGNGDVAFGGDVGRTTALTSLNVTAAKDVDFGYINTATLLTTATGDVTFAGDVRTTASTGVNIRGADILLTGDSSIESTGTTTLYADQTDLVMERGASILGRNTIKLTAAGTLEIADGATITGANNATIVLTSDSIVLPTTADSITGDGNLVLQPNAADAGITVGDISAKLARKRRLMGVSSGGGVTFVLSNAQINALSATFDRIIIGRGRDGGYDSGDAGGHRVQVYTVNARAALLIRAQGADGFVKTEGDLTTSTKGATIEIDAGGDLQVEGSIRTDGGGTITLVTDYNADRAGAMTIAGLGRTRIAAASGDVVLVGPSITLGSATGVASIVTKKGSIGIRVTRGARNRGWLVMNNAASGLYAGVDILVGIQKNRDVRPSSITLAGNVTAGRNVTMASRGDVVLDQFRLRAGGVVSVTAVNDLSGRGGSVISHGGKTTLTADSDRNGQGKRTLTDVGLFGVDTSSLKSVVYKIRITDSIHRGDAGYAKIDITNTGTATFSGMIPIRVYASSDGLLDAPDISLGELNHTVKGLAPGQSIRVRVPLAVPWHLTAGNYNYVAEVGPYRVNTPPAPLLAPADPSVILGGKFYLHGSDY